MCILAVPVTTGKLLHENMNTLFEQITLFLHVIFACIYNFLGFFEIFKSNSFHFFLNNTMEVHYSRFISRHHLHNAVDFLDFLSPGFVSQIFPMKFDALIPNILSDFRLIDAQS